MRGVRARSGGTDTGIYAAQHGEHDDVVYQMQIFFIIIVSFFIIRRTRDADRRRGKSQLSPKKMKITGKF